MGDVKPVRLTAQERRALRSALEIVQNESERVDAYGLPHGRVVLDSEELSALVLAGRRALTDVETEARHGE